MKILGWFSNSFHEPFCLYIIVTYISAHRIGICHFFFNAFSIITIDFISPVPALVNSSLTKPIGSMHLPIFNPWIAHCISFKVNSALISNFAFSNLCLQRSFTTPSNSFKSDPISLLTYVSFHCDILEWYFVNLSKHSHSNPVLSEGYEPIFGKASF